MNASNVQALTKTLMASLGSPGWLPGLGTIVATLSVDSDTLARDLATAGVLDPAVLTPSDLAAIRDACQQMQHQQLSAEAIRDVLVRAAQG